MAESRITRAAREGFGWESLRDGQEESIAALLEGRDVVAVLPTGSGKSAVYQLAGSLLEGVTLVVSPLIALQMDQLHQLEDAPAAPRGVAINSSLADGAIEDAWDSLAAGEARFVFLAPEQLAKDEVIERLHRLGVCLLVVDEAHCVASWGHDFRPDYLGLGAARRRIGSPPTVALTATGAQPVRIEIAERLMLADPLIVVRDVDRPNIDLEVIRATADREKRDAVLDLVPTLGRPGLVYTATRRDAEEYTAALVERGLRAETYHAGLSAGERRRVHQAFLDDESDVVVATNAFGMGIDKPNVRFVVHTSAPDSLDAYYQEIGRAGRDGEPARAVLFYRSEDLGLRKYFAARGTDPQKLAAVYSIVADSRGPVRGRDIATALELSARAVTGLLNLLVEAGAVRLTKAGAVGRGRVEPPEAAARAEEAAERRQRIEESRLAYMRRYAETRDCRRRVLLGYFGDDLAHPCGCCDTCRAGTAEEIGASDQAAPFPTGSPVEHVEWGGGTVVDVEDDRLTVFFDDQGYKVLGLESVLEHRTLTRGD